MQTGGTVTSINTFLGNTAGGTSSFTLSSGNYTSTNGIEIGVRAASTFNLSGGSLNFSSASNSFVGAQTTGIRGIFNISAGTATQTGSFLMVGSDNGSITGAGIVNQSGGLYNMGGSGLRCSGWAGDTNCYASYLFSGGTLQHDRHPVHPRQSGHSPSAL